MNTDDIIQFAGYNLKSWEIGMRRVRKIIEQEKSQGYEAYATGMYADIADIFVTDPNFNLALGAAYDSIIRVYESTNYGPKSYIQLKRAKHCVDHLLQYKAHKIFVCSFEENLRYLPGKKKYFEQYGIEVQVVGYQD